MPKAVKAVSFFNDSDLNFCLHLGDIVDGHFAEDPSNLSETQTALVKSRHDLDLVIAALSKLTVPIVHVIGNHCMSGGRDYVLKSLRLTEHTYYYREISSKWRLIVLDTLDMSVQRPEGHPMREEACRFLREHAAEVNAKDWNGGLGAEQLRWLGQTLSECVKLGMRAIVCGHHPLLPSAARSMHLAWDHQKVLAVFKQYSDVVCAYFCGHDHQGGYGVFENVHHVTFEAVLDADEEGSHGVIEIFEDKILILGTGSLTSRSLDLSRLDI